MKLGQKAMEALKEEITGSLLEGDDLVVAGAIALRGTALLVKYERKILEKTFSGGFLYDAEKCRELYGINGSAPLRKEMSGRKGKTAEEFLERYGFSKEVSERCHAVYAMGEGGVLCALWKMAEASGTGLEADLRKIPVRQETIEICEKFDLDPYRLLSSGSVLLGTVRGRELAEAFNQRKIPAAVIGRAVKGNNRILYSGKITRFLDRPGQDEITKMPWGDKWKSRGLFPGQERKNTVWQD